MRSRALFVWLALLLLPASGLGGPGTLQRSPAPRTDSAFVGGSSNPIGPVGPSVHVQRPQP